MDLQLKGKRARVTGGSRGIGKAIARVLAQEGAAVVLLAGDSATLAAAAAELSGATGGTVVGVSADTTQDDQVQHAVAEAQRLFGGSTRNVAVAALSKNMADELGPLGIQVTVLHPGLTRTERTAPLVAARAAALALSAKQVEAQMAAGNSINHLVDAAEVADVVASLCSPRSRAINGDAIAVGGGAPRAVHY